MPDNRHALPQRPDNHVIVLFGATGDLAKRKLLPGLFHLHAAGLLPRDYRIIGSAPASSTMTDEQFRAHAKRACTDFGITKPDDPSWPDYERRLSFAAAEPGKTADLEAAVQRAEKRDWRFPPAAVPPGHPARRVHVHGGHAGRLRPGQRPEPGDRREAVRHRPGVGAGAEPRPASGLRRVADLPHRPLPGQGIGRQHLGVQVRQRDARAGLEPEHISYVQIDVPETLLIEGRAAFYDATGAYRDMIVTHLFQAMAFVAMEPPVSLSAGPLREEKLKVFQTVKPLDVQHVVRGQYEGYRSEPGVAAGSETDTMVAVRAEVDNWRWHGVPFFLRSGKSMGASRQVVTLGFHQPPMQMFPAHRRDVPAGRRNELVIDFADPGSITIEFLAKVPGPEMSLGQAEMVFTYKDSFASASALEGYERLILDAMLGDQSLFTSSAGIERLWEISAPLLENPPPVQPYARGSWGPQSVDRLIAPHHWHLPDRYALGSQARVSWRMDKRPLAAR